MFRAMVISVAPPAVTHWVITRSRAPLCLSFVFPGSSLVWLGMGVLLRVLLWGLGRWGGGCCVRSISWACFVLFGVSGAGVGALTVIISCGRRRMHAFGPIIPG